jgi:serine/threonine protein kinase
MDRNFSPSDSYSSPSDPSFISPRRRRKPRVTLLDVDFASAPMVPPLHEHIILSPKKKLGRNNRLKFGFKVLQTKQQQYRPALIVIFFLQRYRTIWWYILLLIAAMIYPFSPVSRLSSHLLHSHLHSHLQFLWKQQRPLHHTYYKIGANDDDYDVLFRRLEGDYVPVSAPPRQMYWDRKPDRNSLKISSLRYIHSEELFRRDIAADDEDLFNEERATFLQKSHIDFAKMHKRFLHTEELEDNPRRCYRNNWGWMHRSVCNNFHESTMNPTLAEDGSTINYAGHGYFRDAWAIFEPPGKEGSGDFVLKTSRYEKISGASARLAERENLIMDQLTASPGIVDIYGSCGTSSMLERMAEVITTSIVPGIDVHDYERGYIKQEELNKLQKNDVHPMNNLTAEEKLDMALDMAESIADLHGFEGGVIVHGDIYVDQWMRTRNGKIKLNDFNLGQILDWNPSKQHYCKFDGKFEAPLKSPEELLGSGQKETVDIWGMGHTIYGLLTGLYPYYDEFSKNDKALVLGAIVDGKKPFVDDRYRTRSFIESRLVEIMEKCWEKDPDKRVDIFTIVHHLRQTKQLEVSRLVIIGYSTVGSTVALVGS